MLWSCVLAVVVSLTGVTGEHLRARAFFDANNVKVGDPLVLTIDFLGEADFKALHPPALAKLLAQRDWKLDDASAKTDTFRDARRLTYRVRPMREGVVWFPALTFAYTGTDGKPREVRSNAIPVHAKQGAQVVVAGMSEETAADKMPMPDALVTAVPAGLSADETFAWRKACAKPTAAAFAAFDWPESRLNEARCEIHAGNWARALSIYRRLEWQTGQTPAIERGIVAALALRYDNPRVELPVWRQIGRPILKHAWQGRVGIVTGAFLAVAFLFWLINRGIRAVACIAVVVCCVQAALAQGIFQQFEQMEQRMRQMQQQMMSGMGGGASFVFGGEERAQPKVKATLSASTLTPSVGEQFEFVLSLEAPKTSSLSDIRLNPSERFGMTITGKAQNLPNELSADGSNVVVRFAIPVRYDVPFNGAIGFGVQGMITGRTRHRFGSFSFSNSFNCETPPVKLTVKPLDRAGQPDDFAGIVSEGLVLGEKVDVTRVETNDVVTITYQMRPKGYVPVDYLLPDVAFEWARQNDEDGHPVAIEYRRFYVADGSPATPKISVPYYDPRSRTYKRTTVGGTPLTYK